MRRVMKSQPDRTPGADRLARLRFPAYAGQQHEECPFSLCRGAAEASGPRSQGPGRSFNTSPVTTTTRLTEAPPPGRRTPILPSTLPLTGNQDVQQPEGENHTPSALHAHHPLPRTQDHHDRADTTPGTHELPQGCNANEQRERAHQRPSDSDRGDEPLRHTRAAQDYSRPDLLSRPFPQNVHPYREEEGSKRKEEHGNTSTCQRGKYRLTVIMRMPNAARPTSSTPIT